MPTRNVNLTAHFDRFVEEQVASGKFKNASEVMRAGLRLLEQHTLEDQQKLDTLRAMADQAFEQLDRGEGTTFDRDEQLADFIGQAGRRVARRKGPAESK